MLNTQNDAYKLTRADAVSMLRRAPPGSRFAVHIRGDAAIEGDDEHVIPGGLRGHVGVSRKEAMRIAGEMVSEAHEVRGARVPVCIHTFHGASGSSVTYWIG